MRLLVDTHVLLCAASEPERLPASFRQRLESPANDVFFSAASIWELAIKVSIGRLSLPVPLEEITAAVLRMGFEELPVTAAHAARVSRLPLHHRDPFDRLLIAQALHEPMHFLTLDRTLERYSDLVEVGS